MSSHKSYTSFAHWQKNLRILALAMYLLGTFAQGMTLLLHETSHQWEKILHVRESARHQSGHVHAHGHPHGHTHRHSHSEASSGEEAHLHARWMMVVLQAEDLPFSDEDQDVLTQGLSVHMPAEEGVCFRGKTFRRTTPMPYFGRKDLFYPPENPPPRRRSADMLTLPGTGKV